VPLIESLLEHGAIPLHPDHGNGVSAPSIDVIMSDSLSLGKAAV
jgi:hypothetical protein